MLLQPVKNFMHFLLGLGLQKKDQHERRPPECKGQKGFPAIFISFNAVHFNDAGIRMFFCPKAEILIIMADPVLPVLCSCFRRLFALLVLYLSPQIDVTNIKYTCINVRIHCPAGAFQIFRMRCINMCQRLAVLYQRSQDIIHPLNTCRSLVDPFTC